MEDRQFEPLPTEPPLEESTCSLRTRRLLDTFPITDAASVTESDHSRGVGGLCARRSAHRGCVECQSVTLHVRLCARH
jgi:hypothetical protein